MAYPLYLTDELQNRDHIINAFRTIPNHETSLSIYDTNLHLAKLADLIEGFRAIPANITELMIAKSLHNNAPNPLSCEDLATLLDAIPESVEQLTFNKHDFDRFTGIELGMILEHVKTKKLSLAGNELTTLHLDTLQTAFNCLSPAVEYLDLCNNNFELEPNDYLYKLYSAIPDTVTDVCITVIYPDYKSSEIIKRTDLIAKYTPAASAKDNNKRKIEQPADANIAAEIPATNYSFYLKCLVGISCAGGAALLITGIILLQPTFIYQGAALLVVAAASVAFSGLRFFNQRPTITLDENGLGLSQSL